MLAVSDAFFQSEALPYAVAAIALLAGGLLLLMIFRRASRRPVRAPKTGNAGCVGVVETLALDRRRKLVIVRRGDVEHLIMTGGPNDLVIETVVVGSDGRDPYETNENLPVEAKPKEARLAPIRPLIGLADGPGLLPLAVLSGVAGAGAGLICGLFRVALEEADRLRTSLPVLWQDRPLLGSSLLVLAAAAAGALSAWLVRRFSDDAAGSGIPHVEAIIGGELPPARFILLPVKFAGGLMAIGAGFALGREGPCVQMGATLAHHLGKAFGRNSADCRSLLAAGAGAGLAAAFNAPLAGSAFVLEELVRKFETSNAIAALGASGSAIVVTRLFTGPAPDFIVTSIPYPALDDNLLCIALGVVAGVLGVAYNRVLLGALALADHLARWPVEIRAAIVGAAVGALAWFAPGLAGGGDVLTQRTLEGMEPLALLPFIFMLRLVLGAASYAAGTPGGLFAPLLVLGAQMGSFFGGLFDPGSTDPASHAIAFAVVGMAALFTAVVRAPLTGMILVTETTANTTLLLPMVAACFSAMAVATMLREALIYDKLKERLLVARRKRPLSISPDTERRDVPPGTDGSDEPA
jgi:chloride channel protein, CIC family